MRQRRREHQLIDQPSARGALGPAVPLLPSQPGWMSRDFVSILRKSSPPNSHEAAAATETDAAGPGCRVFTFTHVEIPGSDHRLPPHHRPACPGCDRPDGRIARSSTIGSPLLIDVAMQVGRVQDIMSGHAYHNIYRPAWYALVAERNRKRLDAHQLLNTWAAYSMPLYMCAIRSSVGAWA